VRYERSTNEANGERRQAEPVRSEVRTKHGQSAAEASPVAVAVAPGVVGGDQKKSGGGKALGERDNVSSPPHLIFKPLTARQVKDRHERTEEGILLARVARTGLTRNTCEADWHSDLHTPTGLVVEPVETHTIAGIVGRAVGEAVKILKRDEPPRRGVSVVGGAHFISSWVSDSEHKKSPPPPVREAGLVLNHAQQ